MRRNQKRADQIQIQIKKTQQSNNQEHKALLIVKIKVRNHFNKLEPVERPLPKDYFREKELKQKSIKDLYVDESNIPNDDDIDFSDELSFDEAYSYYSDDDEDLDYYYIRWKTVEFEFYSRDMRM